MVNTRELVQQIVPNGKDQDVRINDVLTSYARSSSVLLSCGYSYYLLVAAVRNRSYATRQIVAESTCCQ